VHCGLESGFFSDAPTFSPVTQGLVCVGRLCEQKGQLLLVDAVRLFRERGVGVSLTLAGDGELRLVIEELIQRCQLETTISMTCWLSSDAVRNQLIKARALVLLSFAEGLPVVIMEAMALKRALLREKSPYSFFTAGRLLSFSPMPLFVIDTIALMPSPRPCLFSLNYLERANIVERFVLPLPGWLSEISRQVILTDIQP
jgi:Glycosyl transferases group 1